MELTRRSLAAGAAALFSLKTARASGARWARAPAAPFAVQEIYPALHEGGIWIAGGFSPHAGGATERVLVFDLRARVWREGPPLPEPRHHVHLASAHGALWALGGYLGGATRTAWIATEQTLRLEGDSWAPGPPLPKPIGEATPVVLDERIHLVGGRSPRGAGNAAWADHGDVADHFALAGAGARWERAAPAPLARNSAAGAAYVGALHVLSGRTVAGGPRDAHLVYCPREDRWRDAPPYPDPRGGLAAAVCGGRLLAGGGEIFDPASVSDGLYAFEGDWRRAALMPVPRHGHGMICAAGALYVLGGAERVGADGALSRVDVLML